MYCSKCGFPIDDDAMYCSNCGQRVIRNERVNTQSFSQNVSQNYNDIMHKPKSKIFAGLLAVLVGSLGIHDFYLGYNQKGVIHLFMFVFFLGWLSRIWGLIEALFIFTGKTFDANGMPLSDNF